MVCALTVGIKERECMVTMLPKAVLKCKVCLREERIPSTLVADFLNNKHYFIQISLSFLFQCLHPSLLIPSVTLGVCIDTNPWYMFKSFHLLLSRERCVCVCVCTLALVPVWRSQDRFLESFLPILLYMVLGTKLRSSGLPSKHLYRALPPAPHT